MRTSIGQAWQPDDVGAVEDGRRWRFQPDPGTVLARWFPAVVMGARWEADASDGLNFELFE